MSSGDGRPKGEGSPIESVGERAGLPVEVRRLAALVLDRFLAAADRPDEASVGHAIAALRLAAGVYAHPTSIEAIARAADGTDADVPLRPAAVRSLARRMAHETGIDALPRSPADYVGPFCDRLGVSVETREVAAEIVDADAVTARAPTTVAAAAIYTATLVTGERVSQKEIEAVTGVNTASLRATYRGQYEDAIRRSRSPSDARP